MKVLQTIPYMRISQGGPSTCTCDLLDGIAELRYRDTEHSFEDVCLLTTKSDDTANPNLGEGQNWLKTVKCDYITPLALSREFNNFLKKNEYEIYHANTLWLYPIHATCAYARKVRKPYIISPHGMLYPTALTVSVWKKKLMRRIWFDNDIHKANCLHTTCIKEMDHCRTFGYKGPIAVIPNPVVIPSEITVKKHIPAERKIGFLGRLHPIKKVEALIYGMAEAIKQGVPTFQLDIMGSGDKNYENFLREEVDRLGLAGSVNFVGFVNGKEKYERLRSLWALFVPSVQENFGMIVPEALICGTPVYASTGTPWEELNSDGCGWWCDNSVASIASVICELFSKSESELLQMGKNGRALIEQCYEQTKVAKMMIDLYRYILGIIEKPSFVYEL